MIETGACTKPEAVGTQERKRHFQVRMKRTSSRQRRKKSRHTSLGILKYYELRVDLVKLAHFS